MSNFLRLQMAAIPAIARTSNSCCVASAVSTGDLALIAIIHAAGMRYSSHGILVGNFSAASTVSVS